MKTKKFQLTGVFLIAILLAFSLDLTARDYYQLKIYNLKDQAQEIRMENYLMNAYLPALHRAGIKQVGVFKPIESDDEAGKKIIVFIPLKNLDELESIESKLAKDTQYQAAGSEYINALHSNPPYERIESILLKAFSKMPEFSVPNHKTSPSEKIYELRSYEGPTEQYYRKKVEMFNEGGEIDLFKRLDFQAVFYGEVISGNAMPNLMYMTTFSDMKSHDEHWNTFRNHPEWKTMSALEKYKNTVSHSVIQLLHPTEYSDI
jgi:hypothetical protein